MFHQIVDTMLVGFDFAVAYLDDIPISKTEDEHWGKCFRGIMANFLDCNIIYCECMWLVRDC